MRLTRRGRIVAILACALGAIALARASATAASAAFLLLAGLSLSAASLRVPRLRVERHVERASFREGEVVRERLAVEALSGALARARIRETASFGFEAQGDAALTLRLTKGARAEREVVWAARHWGLHRIGPLEVVVRDPLGLLEVSSTHEARHEARIEPNPLSVGRFSPRGGNPEPALGAHSVSKPGDSSEFFALRDYQAGDSIRRINWKASARTGRTTVNQVTRDTFARVVVFLDMREKEAIGGAASSLVRSGRAAASVLAHHDRQKDHLTLVTVGREARRLSLQPNPRLAELLGEMTNVEPGGDMSLEEAVRSQMALVRPRSPVYFVTSGALDGELSDAIRLAQALGARPQVISPPPAPGEGEVSGLLARTRDAALDAARGQGIPVHDWPDGMPLEVALARA